MSIKNKEFYITTPIYYVNANPHIGHTYTTIAADILARYHRMIGDNTFFLTGTDEHGAKIEEVAKEAGKEPQEFTDEIAASFQFAWDELNISNDRFIRTSEEGHKKVVQKALQKMYDKGDIYLGKHEGLYCKGCEQYKNEKDLVEGKCSDHKTIPEKMSEESYMFKLSKYKDELLKKIKKDELQILPVEKKNEVISFYENEGLNDISFSRKNVKWGVKLPWDESHTAYVWSDAFLNYLTGLGWDGETPLSPSKSPNPLYQGGFNEFWPADVHLMSKDILRVHATIWPAMLLSLGLKLPKTLFIHGYFMIDGQKMSKSIGNVITPGDLVKKYGVDGARYLVASAASFGHDGDIGWRKFDEKYNADLANGLGNLVSRVLSLMEKFFDSKVPDVDRKFCGKMSIKLDKESAVEFKKRIDGSWIYYQNKFRDIMIDNIIGAAVFSLVDHCDKHISNTELWKLIKEDKEEGAKHIYSLLEVIRHIALMVYPFMPETAEKIYESLGLGQIEKVKFEDTIKWGGLPVDIKIKKPEALFPRLDK